MEYAVSFVSFEYLLSKAVRFQFCICCFKSCEANAWYVMLIPLMHPTILGKRNLCDSIGFGTWLCIKDLSLKGSKLSEMNVSFNMQQALCLLIVLLI